MRLGWMEILLIVVLILLLFGANKFPSMMRNLAEGLKIFKKEVRDEPEASPRAGPNEKIAKTKPSKKKK